MSFPIKNSLMLPELLYSLADWQMGAALILAFSLAILLACAGWVYKLLGSV